MLGTITMRSKPDDIVFFARNRKQWRGPFNSFVQAAKRSEAVYQYELTKIITTLNDTAHTGVVYCEICDCYDIQLHKHKRNNKSKKEL